MKNQFRRAFSIAIVLCFACIHATYAQFALSSVFASQPFLPNSAIIPVPGSKINYTQVMFDHPVVPGAVRYALTTKETESSGVFGTHTINDSSAAMWIGGFKFGSECSWSYVAYDAKSKIIFTSPEYKFTILPLPAQQNVRVVTNEQSKNQGGLISFDSQGIITDREGKPVWFLPEPYRTPTTRDGKVCDLSVTGAGTIIFVAQNGAFEIAPDGRNSWHDPKAGPNTAGVVHDGIQRLPNGNIMTMGTNVVQKPVPFDGAMIPVEFGTIVEYDRTGKLVWKWDAHPYLRPGEIEFRKLSTGSWISTSGLNAFYYAHEQVTDYVYASFRDLNRVVKIEKSTGNVVKVYGRRMGSGYDWKDDKLFASQHDVTPLSEDVIAVFNNDSLSKDGVVSSVVLFSMGPLNQDPKLVWRFAADFDRATSGKSAKGGSVDELPNKNLLVNFGDLGRCIEVTRDGKVVWDAFIESATGQALPQYTSHYASSLYPVWFSLAMQKNTKKAATIFISNEGDAADRYSVEYLANDKWISLASVSLAPGKQTTCIIPKVKGLVFTKIKVSSGANADFYRMLEVK